MIKTYKISDLFITSWLDAEKKPTLSFDKMAALLNARHNLDAAKERNDQYQVGLYSIQILRLLRKNKNAVAKINVEQAVDCINDITFFRMPWYFFPVGEFTFQETTFTPPDEYMHDLTFDHLVYADAAYTKYCVLEEALSKAHPPMDGGSLSELDLNELVAVLYTRNLEAKQISENARKVKQLGETEKFMILHTYANIREYIVKRCPDLFPPSSPDASQPAVSTYTGKMWMNLRYELAETEAFKGFDKARTTLIYDALDYMNKLAKENRELQQKQNAHAKS